MVFFIILITCLLKIILILCGEILANGHLWELKRHWDLISKHITIDIFPVESNFSRKATRRLFTLIHTKKVMSKFYDTPTMTNFHQDNGRYTWYLITSHQWQLTRKNLMAKNLKRLKKQLEREYGKLEAAKYPFWCEIFFSWKVVSISAELCF